MSTTSVNSLSGKDFNIKAYPNPANELIRIEAEDNLRNRNFQIVNSSGKILKTGNLKSKITEIHIADFSSGIYFINIENYGNQPTKFVKL
jgi:tRNA-binding EMAP/Myf-like protein